VYIHWWCTVCWIFFLQNISPSILHSVIWNPTFIKIRFFSWYKKVDYFLVLCIIYILPLKTRTLKMLKLPWFNFRGRKIKPKHTGIAIFVATSSITITQLLLISVCLHLTKLFEGNNLPIHFYSLKATFFCLELKFCSNFYAREAIEKYIFGKISTFIWEFSIIPRPLCYEDYFNWYSNKIGQYFSKSNR